MPDPIFFALWGTFDTGIDKAGLHPVASDSGNRLDI